MALQRLRFPEIQKSRNQVRVGREGGVRVRSVLLLLSHARVCAVARLLLLLFGQVPCWVVSCGCLLRSYTRARRAGCLFSLARALVRCIGRFRLHKSVLSTLLDVARCIGAVSYSCSHAVNVRCLILRAVCCSCRVFPWMALAIGDHAGRHYLSHRCTHHTPTHIHAHALTRTHMYATCTAARPPAHTRVRVHTHTYTNTTTCSPIHSPSRFVQAQIAPPPLPPSPPPQPPPSPLPPPLPSASPQAPS